MEPTIKRYVHFKESNWYLSCRTCVCLKAKLFTLHLLLLLLKLTLYSLNFIYFTFIVVCVIVEGIAKALPDKAIAPVTMKRRAAAHPKRSSWFCKVVFLRVLSYFLSFLQFEAHQSRRSRVTMRAMRFYLATYIFSRCSTIRKTRLFPHSFFKRKLQTQKNTISERLFAFHTLTVHFTHMHRVDM